MELTHFDEHGNARMVDVSEKDITSRSACAVGSILVNKEIIEKIEHSDMKKGDVLGVARIAGIMGVKKTSELIPLCHPLMINKVNIDFDVALYKVDCNARQSLVENLVIGFAIINAAHDHQLNIIKPGAASQHRSTGGGNRSSASQLQERTARNRAHKNPSKIKSIHPKHRRSPVKHSIQQNKVFCNGRVHTLYINTEFMRQN